MHSSFNRRHMLLASAGFAAIGFDTLNFAIPACAGDLGPPPLEAYAKSPVISKIALSPDAQKIAILTQDGDNQFLKTFNRNASTSRTIGLGTPRVFKMFWSDNDNVLLMTSITAKGFSETRDEFRARILNPATAKIKTLWARSDTDEQAFISGNVHRVKTDSGYRITASAGYYFQSFSARAEDTAADYQVPLKASAGIIPPLIDWPSDTVISPDGRITAISVAQEEGHGFTKGWTVKWNTSAPGKAPYFKTIFETTYVTESPVLLGLSGDGNSLLITQYDDQTGWNYYVLFADGKLSEPLDIEGRVTERLPLFHPVTLRFAGYARYKETLSYDYFDPILATIAKAIPEVMGENSRTAIVDFAEDPRQLIVYSQDADDAGSYFFLDLAAGVTTFLANDYPQLAKPWLSEKVPLTYKAADGLEIPAYLTLPTGKPAKNLPLVVLVHGGPQARDTIDFDWQAQALAAQGYAVLQANFRGSGGYGMDFLEAGYGQFGRKMQTDLSDGVRYLASEGTIDPKRVAIAGASYGGYAALAGATLDRGVYNCAISIAGVSDLKYKMRRIDNLAYNHYDSTTLYWQRYFGAGDLDEISPIAHADEATIPVLLVHGKSDTVVEYEHSVRMDKALRDAGKTVEFISYDGQDHWETLESARIDMIRRVVNFLRKYNPA